MIYVIESGDYFKVGYYIYNRWVYRVLPINVEIDET